MATGEARPVSTVPPALKAKRVTLAPQVLGGWPGTLCRSVRPCATRRFAWCCAGVAQE
jgi:hypothetical protein